ncbi:hypothetical protein PV325_002422 [Microctonus aethiopoides]|nr:hypothetical protein PV325_002422 [Microctonus aethiopoides]
MKIICMLISRHDLHELLKISDKYFNSLKNSPRSIKLFRNFSTFWYLLWILLGTGILVCSTGTIPPIIYFILDELSHVKSHHNSLPVKVAYPWLPRIEGIYYVLHWMQQAYIGFIPVILNCSVEVTFSLLVFRMISELRDMSYHIAHLDESNDQDSVIRNCTNQYVELLKYRDSIQNIFGPIILQMFISNAIQLCAGVFVLSQLTPNAIHITFFTAYVVTKGAQTCLCAFAGSLLITERKLQICHILYQLAWEQTTDDFGFNSTQSEAYESGSLSLYGYLTQHFSIGSDIIIENIIWHQIRNIRSRLYRNSSNYFTLHVASFELRRYMT